MKMIELETENPETEALLKALHILDRPIENLQNINQ